MAALPENQRKWPYVALAVLSIGYWLAIFVATHWPSAGVPDAVSHNDKLAHFAAYAGLACLLATFLLIARREWRIARVAAVVLLVAAVYGILDETTQTLVGRTSDIADWLADMAGATVGTLAATILSMIWRRTS
jgi:VanZ family protein